MRFASAIGFVDWNTALFASGPPRSKRPDVAAQAALQHVEGIVSDHLLEVAEGARFQVRLRLYGGWHAGVTPTEQLHGAIRVREGYGARVRKYHDGRIAFLAGADGIRFGARLACVPGRLPRRHDVHLLDTLRTRDGRRQEKMVDTALVADVLGLVGRRAADRYVVVSDDDDMLPGLFAAEAAGARICMLSRPGRRSRFMAHAADLVSTYESVGR